jgi:hypothetical protein
MTPIETMLETVEWTAGPETEHGDGDLWATHSGVLDIAGISLRCYRLNNGQAVFNADDFKKFFDCLNLP